MCGGEGVTLCICLLLIKLCASVMCSTLTLVMAAKYTDMQVRLVQVGPDMQVRLVQLGPHITERWPPITVTTRDGFQTSHGPSQQSIFIRQTCGSQ